MREEIDHLYDAYVDVLEGRAAVEAARANLVCLTEVPRLARERAGRARGPEEGASGLILRQYHARGALVEAEGQLLQARRNLTVLLALPPDRADGLEVRGSVHDRSPPPPGVEELLRLALGSVHDSAGPGPQRGGHRRARIDLAQVQLVLEGLERRVTNQVQRARTEYEASREAVRRHEQEGLPAAGRLREEKLRRFVEGKESIAALLAVQQEHGEMVRRYLEARPPCSSSIPLSGSVSCPDLVCFGRRVQAWKGRGGQSALPARPVPGYIPGQGPATPGLKTMSGACRWVRPGHFVLPGRPRRARARTAGPSGCHTTWPWGCRNREGPSSRPLGRRRAKKAQERGRATACHGGAQPAAELAGVLADEVEDALIVALMTTSPLPIGSRPVFKIDRAGERLLTSGASGAGATRDHPSAARRCGHAPPGILFGM